jgi:4-amino-4-deoxy-L-arabinose transferase-like glycosyltransferase
MTALFSLPGWPVENGARLCSLFFSAVVFLSLLAIGKRFHSPPAAIVSLVLLAINPTMVGLSRSVLTEPVYIGLVYTGLWLLLRQAEAPTWKSGAALGALFALAFLARTEGLIFLVALPVIQLALAIFTSEKRNYKTLVAWTTAFVVSFCAVAAPQVWRVSHKMGHFAINGRQAWEVIMNNPDGKSYDQKIYGLDYSPQQINLEYIQSHPEAVKAMASTLSLPELLGKAGDNVLEFFRRKLPAVISLPGVVLLALGFFALWRERRYARLIWILGFLGASLAGPFVHDVDVRHIAVIIPLLTLIQGVGLASVAGRVAEVPRLRTHAGTVRIGVASAVVFAILLIFLSPLRAAMLPPRDNRDYAIDDYREPLAILQKVNIRKPMPELRIAARKGYLAYVAGAQEVFIPYTDYFGFVEYCRLNRVDIIFVEHDELAGFPFHARFAAHTTPEFELLHRQNSRTHGMLELYRVLHERMNNAASPN